MITLKIWWTFCNHIFRHGGESFNFFKKFFIKIKIWVFSAAYKRTSNVFLMKLHLIIIFKKCIIPNDDSFLRLIINKNSFSNEKTLYFLAFLYENTRDFCEHSLVVQQFKIAVTYCLNSQLVVLIADKLNQNCVGLS